MCLVRVRPLFGWLRVVAVSGLVVVAAMAPLADARTGPTPLSYHATVVNGPVTGSSFMIADGVAVTNAHVLNGRRPGEQVTLVIPGARRTNAVVIAVSPNMDLALLRVQPGFLPVAPGGRGTAAPGEPLVAAGVAADSRRRMTVAGNVQSGVRHLAPFGPGLTARMPGIRRGFSGGPVFASDGRLVGMVAAVRPIPGSASARDAFILSADAIRRETNRLMRRL